MLKGLRSLDQKERIGIQKGKGLFRVELLKIGLGFKTSLDSRRFSQIKLHQNFPSLGRRDPLGLEFKKGREGIHLMRSHFAGNVGRSSLVLAWHDSEKCFDCGNIGV